MTIWMLVTQDKYELPLLVSDSLKEFAKAVGKTKRQISDSYSCFKRGVTKTCKYRKVEIDE